MTLTKNGEDKEKHQSGAVGIYPKDEAAWTNIGLDLNDLDRFEEALIAFDKAIEINPNKGDIWIFKGISLGHLGRTEEAFVAFDKAIEINPKDEFACYVKTKALLNNGKYEWTRKILTTNIQNQVTSSFEDS
jgi:tetratricopeptide (TPR) repeat protein